MVPGTDRWVAGMNPRKKVNSAPAIPAPVTSTSPGFPPGILNGRGAFGLVMRSRTTEMYMRKYMTRKVWAISAVSIQ